MKSSRSTASPPKPSRIVIVDDHPMVRERLAEVIQRESDLSVCGEAEDTAGALKQIEATRPDLAIVDLTLKHSHGLELIEQLHSRFPQLLILVISMHDESLYAERVVRAGAHGYITKQEATRNMLLAVRTVLDGKVYLSPTVALRLATNAALSRAHRKALPTLGAALPLDSLADREMRVFELIGQGFGTRQIAEQLAVDIRTIETYRARIKEKLDLKDANELLQLAIRWNQSGGLRK